MTCNESLNNQLSYKTLHLINKAKELAATIKQGKETHAIGRIHSLGCCTMFIIRWYNILHFCGWVNKWHTLNCDLFNVFNVKSSLSMCHDHVGCKVKCWCAMTTWFVGWNVVMLNAMNILVIFYGSSLFCVM